jgi:MGT family glycosyltransferase
MTRVLFACWPFESHLFPQLGIALALRERGAEVAFLTDGSVRELLEEQGFELFPFAHVPPAWERVHGRGASGARETVRLLRDAREWIVGTIPAQVADLQHAVARFEPDVLGAEASMWGPLLVLSDLLPIPVALVSPLIGAGVPGPDAPPPGGLAPAGTRRARALNWAAARLTRAATRPMRRRLDGLRAEHGLPPMRCSVHAFLGRLPLYLVHSVAELDYRRRDLPPSVHYVGDCTWRPLDPPGTAEWLDALPQERPWVHATQGSSLSRDPLVLRAAAEGLAGLPVEVILTTGRLADAHARGLGTLPPNVHAVPWLSHDVLLPRCAAIVTTGGQGTVTAALRAGVPLVVVPAAFDQPGVAERVVAAGVGVRVSPRRCTPERLRAAVERVLDDPRYRREAQRAAELLSAAPGPDGAADLIERAASARRGTGAAGEATVERAAT